MDELMKLERMANVFCIRCRERLFVGELRCLECKPAWEEAEMEAKAEVNAVYFRTKKAA